MLIAETKGDGGELVAVRRDVEVLHAESQRTLVRGTLQEGDEVIVSGTHRVVAGQRIRELPVSELASK